MGKQNFKVGIATFFKNNNYGAVLQAHALQKAIDSLGYESEIINYIPINNDKVKFLTKVKRLFGKVIRRPSYLLSWFQKRKNSSKQTEIRSLLFENFRKNYLKVGKFVSTANHLDQLCKIYRVGICGSDQIWNPQIARIDPVFFLKNWDTKKKIAYAPSIGLKSIPKIYLTDFVKALADFKFLSCREEEGAEYIKKATGKSCPVVLDPTLLVDNFYWKEIAQPVSTSLPQRYLLCYFIGNDSSGLKLAEKIATKYDLPIVLIPPFSFECKNKLIKLNEVGPREFLYLFSKASAVLTNSFHGTAFAANLSKPFLTLDFLPLKHPKNRSSRISTLLKKLNLNDRLLRKPFNVTQDFFHFDANKLQKCLSEERNKSKLFLKNALLIVSGQHF